MTFQDLLNYIKPQANPNGVGTNTGPIYTEPGLASVGGSTQLPFGLPQVGGTLGIDNGQLFGNMNVNHQPVAAFGPGDSNLVDNGGRPQNQGVPMQRISPIIDVLQKALLQRRGY